MAHKPKNQKNNVSAQQSINTGGRARSCKHVVRKIFK